MDFTLKQTGRAAVEFAGDLGRVIGPLKGQIAQDMSAKGLSNDTLAADLDERMRQVDGALADSPAYAAFGAVTEWSGRNHGRIVQAAFDEQRDDLAPRLDALMAKGPTRIEARAGEQVPEYFKGWWIHRTTGGWDGHPYQGFVHGELLHREYVARNYPGDIFAQRREILSVLPRQDYRRIFEIGTSSAHYTMQLAKTYPQAEIWGCDLSMRMLEQAQRVANEHGWHWRLLQVAGEDTGLEAASFDLVTSYIVMHETSRPRSRARSCARRSGMLRPGGDVLFTDVTRYDALDRVGEFWAEYQAVNGGEPFWREAARLDLGAAAREAGFVNVRSEGFRGAKYPWFVYGHKPE
jgi:2-polyprenyl-3-methyl-5-hydroxy-6-metoxy-1,4-benzoquinol methylase